ncbi:hypothetical protein DFH09DRAFT_1118876, partial [Mycena vulgaris]
DHFRISAFGESMSSGRWSRVFAAITAAVPSGQSAKLDRAMLVEVPADVCVQCNRRAALLNEGPRGLCFPRRTHARMQFVARTWGEKKWTLPRTSPQYLAAIEVLPDDQVKQRLEDRDISVAFFSGNEWDHFWGDFSHACHGNSEATALILTVTGSKFCNATALTVTVTVASIQGRTPLAITQCTKNCIAPSLIQEVLRKSTLHFVRTTPTPTSLAVAPSRQRALRFWTFPTTLILLGGIYMFLLLFYAIIACPNLRRLASASFHPLLFVSLCSHCSSTTSSLGSITWTCAAGNTNLTNGNVTNGNVMQIWDCDASVSNSNQNWGIAIVAEPKSQVSSYYLKVGNKLIQFFGTDTASPPPSPQTPPLASPPPPTPHLLVSPSKPAPPTPPGRSGSA